MQRGTADSVPEQEDIFAQLHDIDWQAGFEGAVQDIAARASEPGPGSMIQERLEFLFSHAELSREYVNMQRLVVALGGCCANEAMQEAITASEYLRDLSTNEAAHKNCDDHASGASHDDKNTQKNKKKRKRISII